jgi:hypothetical protein
MAVFSDIYTSLLALTFLAIFGTAVFLAVKCASEYGSIFTIAKP